MHQHSRNHGSPRSDSGIVAAVMLNLLLSVVEVVGGLISGSLSLVADALHNFNNVGSLVIALVARHISRKEALSSVVGRSPNYRVVSAVALLVSIISIPLATAEPTVQSSSITPVMGPAVQDVPSRTPPPEMVAPPVPNQRPSAQRLTLTDLEAIALSNNPTLVQASALVEAARGVWLQVGLPPNPVVGYQGGEIGNEGRAGQQGVFVGQQFVTGGKLRLNRAVASREVDLAQQRFAVQRYRVVNDVRIGFYEVLTAQRTIELANQLASISQEAVTTTRRLLGAQEASRAELLQAEIEAEQVRIVLTNAQNRHESAWRSLAAVLGVPQMPPAALAGNLQEEVPPLNWEDALGRLLGESPELAAARAGVERARWALRRSEVEPIPNLLTRLGVQYDHASQDTIAGVQVGLPLPLWNRNQGGIRRAQAELRAALSEASRIELSLHNRLAAAFNRYADAKNQAEKYSREILPKAQETLELVNRAYRQGEYGFLIVLTVQRTYFQTSLAYVDSLRELRTSKTVIDGLLLSGSLDGGRGADAVGALYPLP